MLELPFFYGDQRAPAGVGPHLPYHLEVDRVDPGLRIFADLYEEHAVDEVLYDGSRWFGGQKAIGTWAAGEWVSRKE